MSHFVIFLNRSTELSNLAYFKQYSYFPIRVPNVFTHFAFVFTHFPFVFSHFPFVFSHFPFVFTRVHWFSFVFIRVHSCSLVFIRVPLVFHSCSTRVPLVFIRVHSCSDLCGVLDMIVDQTVLTTRMDIICNLVLSAIPQAFYKFKS